MFQYDDMNKKEYSEVVKEEIYGFFPVDGMYICDVGATGGEYTLWAVSKGAEFVYAFEPNLRHFNRLKRHITANKYVNAVLPLNLALANDKVLKGEWSREDWFVKGNANFTQITAAKLDDLNIHKLDIIKVNVEGFEMDVLRGAEGVIKELHPKIMVETSTTQLKEIEKFLGQYGYKKVHMTHSSHARKEDNVYYFEVPEASNKGE